MADFAQRFNLPDRVTADAPEPGAVRVSVPRYMRTATEDPGILDFLTLAKKRFRTAADSENRMRAEQLVDQKFMSSEQWPDNIRADRDIDGRPCLTINRLPVFKRQVTNQQRQAKPAIQVNPVDSNGDPKTAEVFQGIIRHIEIQSSADVAYDTACDNQLNIGRGWIRVVTEWSEDDPWSQDIKIKRVRNPFTVYCDPACQEADYSDARFMFVIEDVPKDEFRQRYPRIPVDGIDQFVNIGDRSSDWMPEGKVRVAEYWYVDVKEESITLLSNGEEIPTEAVNDPEFTTFMETSGVRPMRSRTVLRRSVKWAKITGASVLEERDWPGKWIPIVPVLGDEVDINGQVDLRGIVRDARDPQRMYNYWVSAETEAIALAPRTPFVGAEGQFEGHELKWKLANRRNFPYLEYKPKTLGNELVPPPQRQTVEPPIQAIVMATRQADNDLKAVTGLYDASLGEQGPEESGRAILARQRQGDLSNSHWVDNLVRALRAVGRILIDLIPKIYDAPRVMRIIGVDQQPKMVLVHAGNAPEDVQQFMEAKGLKVPPGAPGGPPLPPEPTIPPPGPEDARLAAAAVPPPPGAVPPPEGGEQLTMGDMLPPPEEGAAPPLPTGTPPPEEMVAQEPAPAASSDAEATGIEGIYDLGAGRYDVTVSVGPSFQSRRQEAVEAMTAFISAFPPAAPVIGDLLAENMDWPGATVVAKRLRKLVPPEVLETQPGQPDLPPQIQAQLQQQGQMIQMLQQAMAEAQQIIQTKRVENESRERIAMIQAQTEMAVATLNKDLESGKIAIEERNQKMELQLETQRLQIEKERMTLEALQKQNEFKLDTARLHHEIENDEDEMALRRRELAAENAHRNVDRVTDIHKVAMAGLQKIQQAKAKPAPKPAAKKK